MKPAARDSIVNGILAVDRRATKQEAENMSNIIVATLRRDGYRLVDEDVLFELDSVNERLGRA